MTTFPSRTPSLPQVEADRLDTLVVNLQRHGLDESEPSVRAEIVTLVERECSASLRIK
jgi:hypothetical protein